MIQTNNMTIEYLNAEYIDIAPKYAFNSFDYKIDKNISSFKRLLITLDDWVPFDKLLDDILLIYHCETGRDIQVKELLDLKSSSFQSMMYSVFELLDEPRLLVGKESKKERDSLLKLINLNKKENSEGPFKSFEKYERIRLEEFWSYILFTGYDQFTYAQEPGFDENEDKVPDCINGLDLPIIKNIVFDGSAKSIETLRQAINNVVLGQEINTPQKRTITYTY